MALESFFVLGIGLWTCMNNNISYYYCQVYYSECEQLAVNKIIKIVTMVVIIKQGFIHAVHSQEKACKNNSKVCVKQSFA